MMINYNRLGCGRDTWLKKDVGDIPGYRPRGVSQAMRTTWLTNFFLLILLCCAHSGIAQYCTPAPTFPDGNGITNVSYGSVSNPTTGEPIAYADFSSLSSSHGQGTSVNLNVEFSTGYIYAVRVWVDWNNDFDFDDAGEQVFAGECTADIPSAVPAGFTVPAATPLGTYRMRIGGVDEVFAGPITSCYTGQYGTFEDYSLQVTSPPVCGTPSSPSYTLVSSTSGNISWTAATPAPSSGYDYEVRSSGAPGSGAVGLAASGATLAGVTSASVSGLATGTSYTLYVRSDCSSEQSGWVSTGFSTPSVIAMPWVEGFATNALPPNWTQTGYSVDSFGAGGNPGFAIYRNFWTSSQTGTFTTPSVGPVVANTFFTFDYKLANFSNSATSPAANAGTWTVAISTNYGATFTTIDTFTNNGSFGYLTKSYSLAAYVGQDVRFRISGQWLSGDYYINFDNFAVQTPPTCFAPTNVSYTATSSTGGTISWTAPATAPSNGYNYEIRTSGAAGSGATGLAVSGSTLAGVTSASITGLTGSTAYTLYVRGNCGVGDTSVWTSVAFTTPPANDFCADAITLPSCSGGAQVVNGTTINSTVDSNYVNCGGPNNGTSTTERGVWYKYVGDNMQVTLNTCSSTTYDSRISVYTGTCGALSCVVTNDDNNACTIAGLSSEVTFNAVAGTEYLVFVHGYQFGTSLSATGNFAMNITCAPICTPATVNDECANATPVSVSPTGVASSNLCATPSIGVAFPSCDSSFATYFDAWYSFNSGSNTVLEISAIVGSGPVVGYAVYSGTCAALTQVGCNTIGSASNITLTANTDYLIRVYSKTAVSRNSYTVTVKVPCLPATGITTSNVTTTTATISWTASASLPSNGYEYEIRTSGAAGSGATGLFTSGTTAAGVTTANITGLASGGVTYSVYVRASCAAGDNSPWAGPTTFVTLCNPITSFPWSETFETTSASISCFTVVNAAGSGAWGISTVNPRTGARCASINTDFSSSNSDYLITPQLTMGAEPKRLRFWVRCNSTFEPDEIAVKVSTTTRDLPAFTTTVLPSTPVNTLTYVEYVVDLTAFVNQNIFIAFVRENDPQDGWVLYMDDVLVENIPTSITSFTPAEVCAAGGETVTITGVAFTGATAVNFYGTPATSFVVNSNTTITAIMPANAATGKIEVIAPTGTALSANDLIVNPMPNVSPITFDGDGNMCVGGATIDMNSATVFGLWSSSDEDVATVDGNGIVTAVSAGTATISYTVTDNGCSTSVTDVVNVTEPISSTSPVTQTVVTGSTAIYSVAATGGIASYQWMVSTDMGATFSPVADGPNYSGSNTDTLTITNTPASFNGYFYMVHIEPTGVCDTFDSSPAILNVGDTGIDADPSNVTLCSTGTGVATFTLDPSGEGSTPTFSWFVDTGLGFDFDSPIADGSFANVTFSGATTASLTVSNITTANSGWQFIAAVQGPANGATSNPAVLTVNEGVVFGSNTGNALMCSSGTTASSFTVNTTGNVSSYQWQYSTSPTGPWTNVANGTPATLSYSVSNVLSPIAGQSTLTVNKIAGTPAGIYYYQLIANASAPCAAATSAALSLTVGSPTIAVTPPSATYCVPGTAVSLTANGGVSYSWSPATGLSATTGATVTASPATTTTYTVVGTDANGCTSSATVTVTVGNGVTAIATATPGTVCPGGAVQLNSQGLVPFTTSTANLYTFSTSTGAALNPMTGATNVGVAPNDDTGMAATGIGFTFNFNGTNYTDFSASPDGFIRMGTTTAADQFTNSMTSATNTPKIAPYWDDVALGGTGLGGYVRKLVVGTAPSRICIVEWNVTIPRNTTGTPNSKFQLWMYETTNVIEFRYGTMASAFMSATVGIRGTGTGNFHSATISSNTSSTVTANDGNSGQPASGRMYRYTPGNQPVLTYAWTSVPAGFTSSAANPVVNPSENTQYNVTITAASGCSGTGSVNVVIETGAAISTQPLPQQVCEGQPATFTVAATGPGLTYQWRLNGSPVTGNASATTATLSIPATTLAMAGDYDVVVTGTCGAPAISNAVALTLNALPVLSPSASSACIGGSLTLSANATNAASVSWSGPNGFTSTDLNPVIASVTSANSGVYTLNAISAAGCSTSKTLAVTVNALPAAIAIAPSSAALCSADPAQLLTATGGNVSALSENFSNDAAAWTRVNAPTSPVASNFTIRTSPYTYSFTNYSTTNGGKFIMANADVGGSGSTTNTQFVSPSFSTVGLNSATLTFEHFYQAYSGDVTVLLQISTNGGSTWSTLVDYKGTTVGTATVPAPASVSLNAYLNQSNVMIRYNYVSVWGFYWVIDNIQLNGTQLPIWSPTAGLFTDAAATVPYSGAASSTVYAKPASTTSYSATVTSGAGCTRTQSVNVAVTTATTYYADMDLDGFGNALMPIMACAAAPGVVANSNDCDDSSATVYPGAPEIGYNLIDDDCDGLIDEGFPPKVTTVAAATCGTTLATIDQMIYAGLVSGAQGYQWRITTIAGPNVGQVQLLDTPLRQMKLTQLVNYAFGATYKVEVAVYIGAGPWLQPYAASNCNITTPGATTQLTICGQTLSNINDIIYANNVPFAAGYRFRITDPLNPTNTQTIDRTIRDFKLNMVTAFVVQYNKSYNVDVAIKNTDGTYLPYGAVCQVMTPMFPTTGIQDVQCDNGLGGAYAVPSMTTPIYAVSYPGAIAYAFRLTGSGLPVGGVEVVKNLRVFTLNDFAGMGIVPGSTYNVNVRLIFNLSEPAGPYGKTCSLTVPGGSRIKAVEFNAIAYPNPFAESFNIDLTTSVNDKVGIKIYDMAGRLLEERTATVSETESVSLGDRYPAGVYNVIVSQGEEVKTLRVIKR